MGTVYITTPIYYPNDIPHMGHAYTTIVADIMSRWFKLKGEEVYFLTGTDEHGLKLQRVAEKAGLKPKEFVDKMAAIFKDYWKKLEIEYSRFIRTTDADHEELVKYVLSELWRRGYVYKGKYGGWYCTSCERFYSSDEWVVKDSSKLCPIHLKELEWFEEETYFLKFSELTEEITRVLKEEDRVYPKQFASEVLGKLRKEGLKDLSITRPKSRVYWGVEVPWDSNHTVYVWIDALLNYLTGAGFRSDEEKFRKFWPSVIHIIGKDILWFHTAIWFALLKMLGVEYPRKVVVHSFILVKGLKMGKSLGNVVGIDDLLGRYGSADALRFIVARIFTLDKDVELTASTLDSIYNADLADTFGNLLRRVSVLTVRKLNGIIEYDEVDGEVREYVEVVMRKYSELMDNFRINEASNTLFDLFRYLNSYLNRKEPWREARPNKTLYNIVEALKYGLTLLHPIMPETTQFVAKKLGLRILKVSELKFGERVSRRVEEIPVLFRKLKG